MNARAIIDLLERRPAPASRDRTQRRYKVATFHRDHHDEDDPADMIKAQRLAKTLPGAMIFEFGNSIVDEYVVVVTDDPSLESHVDNSDGEATLHDLAALDADDGDWIVYATFEELQQRIAAKNSDDDE